jgi:Ca2+-binding RTX toxin-like protein
VDNGAGGQDQYQATTQSFSVQQGDNVSIKLDISGFTNSSGTGGNLRSDKITVEIFSPTSGTVSKTLTLEYLNNQWVSSNGATVSLSTVNNVTTATLTYSGVATGDYRIGFKLNDGTPGSAKLTVAPSDLMVGTATDSLYYPNLGADPVTLAANAIQGNLFTNDYLGTSGATIEAIGSATPVGGVITIATSYGTLSVNATSGAYTYTLNTGGDAPTAGITESFTYTLKGSDGAESQANLNINFANSLSSTATAGADALFGQSVSGGAGDDHIVGTNAGSTLLGGQGSDTLEGGSGTDTLNGGTGNDYLNSGAGNDILIGGEGDDILFGGSGADTFVWQSGDLGNDVIKDFNSSEGDRIDLRDLLSTVDEADLSNYLRLDTDSSSLLISTTGAFGTGGAADITIKVENAGGNVYNSSDAISSLIAGGDLLIKTPQD